MAQILLKEGVVPPTPPLGYATVYIKGDGLPYTKDDQGVETPFVGPKGDTGPAGTAATVDVGSTTTGAPGTPATVVNSGTTVDAILEFTIPQGAKGDTGNTGSTGAKGDQGTAATATVGTTTTGGAGSSAVVVNSGSISAAIFDFTIPRGDVGSTGAKGDKGDTGNTGSAATATAGTTTTGAPGSSAAVVNSGSTSAAVFDFTVPRGDTGSTGAAGTNGTNGAPGSVWYEGSGAPSGATGINGDYYLNVANGDVYLKAAGSWSVVGNIKGPAGSGSGDVSGPAGATGNNIAVFDGATGKLIKDGGTLGTAAFTASTAYDVAGAAAAVTPTTLGLVIGTNVQAYDADLTTWAGVTPGTGVATALGNTAGAANGVATYNQLGTAAFTAASTYVPYSGATGAIDLNNQSVFNVSHLAVGTTTVPTILSRFIGDNGSSSRSSIRGYSNDANSSSWRLTKFRGVAATPLVPQSGDSLGKYEFAGYTTTTSDGVPSATWEAVTTELWSATARGTKVQLKVTANTTTTQAVAMTVDQDKSATFAGTVSAPSIAITGTAGAGFQTFVGQSSNPAAPAAGTLLVHSKTLNGFTRLEQDNEAATNVIYARDNVFIASNPTGTTIPKGSTVYVSGTVSGAPQVQLARANSSSTLPCVGVALDAIAGGAFGQIMYNGLLTFDTSAFSATDKVWVSTTAAGGLQNTRPSGTTNFVQRMGTILVSGNSSTGLMFVHTAPAVLNMETGTNAATWTGSTVVALTGISGGTF